VPRIALLISALLGVADPDPQPMTDMHEALAYAAIPPADAPSKMILEALPPPPIKVVRHTRYFGTVTIDHRAHLKRRAACRSCHGEGAVTKITFTPQIAHERCIGCHQQAAAGPTGCRECHVKEPEPPPQQLAKAEQVVPGSTAPNSSSPSTPAYLATIAALERAPADRGDSDELSRTLGIGFISGAGSGASVRVCSRQGMLMVTQGVERVASDQAARTLALLGFGVSRPVHRRVALEAEALGGLDAVERPLFAFRPAVGARVGVEVRPHWRIVQTVNLGVTGLLDVTPRSANDQGAGHPGAYVTVSTGLGFPPH
jgi:hypothetical protein